MSTHNICFHGEIKKISIIWLNNNASSEAVFIRFAVSRQRMRALIGLHKCTG